MNFTSVQRIRTYLTTHLAPAKVEGLNPESWLRIDYEQVKGDCSVGKCGSSYEVTKVEPVVVLSISELASLLKEAKESHTRWEKEQSFTSDSHSWEEWYARFIAASQQRPL